jgi:hypothetical protein
MQYSFRTSILESEKTYRLTPEGITISSEGAEPELVRYDEVRALNVQFNGDMHGVSRYRCMLRTDKKKIALTNAHYVSLGNFQQRDRDYSRFVAALHIQLQPYADRIRFTQGSGVMYYSALLFAIVMPPMFAVGLYLLVMKGDSLTFSGRHSLFVMPFLLTLLVIPVLRKGRPKLYSGKQLPQSFLPALVKFKRRPRPRVAAELADSVV